MGEMALSTPHAVAAAPAALRKYRTLVKQLLTFGESGGYVMLDQLTSGDLDVFYGGLKRVLRAKAKRLGTLWAFFRFCVNREWLTKSPVSGDLKPPLGSSRVANKIPFTDGELERIIKACDALGEVRWSSGKGEGSGAERTRRISSGRSPFLNPASSRLHG
jgi:hypothetical protein